jgi:hypothetical protein
MPRPRWNSRRPSSRSWRSARRTVLVLTPRTAARSRAGGSRSPGTASPSAIARRMSAATWSCRSAGSVRSTLTFNIMLVTIVPMTHDGEETTVALIDPDRVVAPEPLNTDLLIREARERQRKRRRRLAALGSTIVVGAGCLAVLLAGSSARSLPLLARPLHFPSLGPGGQCPVSSGSSVENTYFTAVAAPSGCCSPTEGTFYAGVCGSDQARCPGGLRFRLCGSLSPGTTVLSSYEHPGWERRARLRTHRARRASIPAPARSRFLRERLPTPKPGTEQSRAARGSDHPAATDGRSTGLASARSSSPTCSHPRRKARPNRLGEAFNREAI